MKPYKLKHTPTGLYWQPITNRGSHFSKRGKIYQTKTNMLTPSCFADLEQIFGHMHMKTL